MNLLSFGKEKIISDKCFVIPFKIEPIYGDGVDSAVYEAAESGEEELLRSCYRRSLDLAYANEWQIFLVVFDTESTRLGLNLYPDLEAYIDHNYVCDKREKEYSERYFGSVAKGATEYKEYRKKRKSVEKALRYPKIEDSDECCEISSAPAMVSTKFDCFSNRHGHIPTMEMGKWNGSSIWKNFM